jgi:hypothetical protein
MTYFQHPDFNNPVTYTDVQLSNDPDTQVKQTIALMSKYVLEDANTEAIQQDARNAAVLGNGNPVDGVFAWVKRNMVFQKTRLPRRC